MGVNPSRRRTIVAPLPQIANILQKSQNNGFKTCELIWVGIMPFFWMRATLCCLQKIGVEVRSKTNPDLISKLLTLKTTIAIPIIISYIIKLQHLKSGLWVVTNLREIGRGKLGLTQNWKTMTLWNLITIDLSYFIMCEDPAWIKIHWNSIWFRASSHTTSHYTWGPMTTLHDFGSMWDGLLDTFFWSLTICMVTALGSSCVKS